MVKARSVERDSGPSSCVVCERAFSLSKLKSLGKLERQPSQDHDSTP